MDTNRSLTGVQKLSYLRAQLGETCDVIAGFPLTNTSYADSIVLLKERFGQSYKQIEAHRQALIDLLRPSHTSSSVQYVNFMMLLRAICGASQYWDRMKIHMAACLPQSCYPGKMIQNMARAHGKRKWTITELRTCIRDELYILELGSHTEPNTTLPPTASFYSSVSKPKPTKSKIQCSFCKGSHTTSMCEQVTDPLKHVSIVCQERLCFNCLGHHKISNCNSKHRCHNCRRKHHTSLCSHDLQ